MSVERGPLAMLGAPCLALEAIGTAWATMAGAAATTGNPAPIKLTNLRRLIIKNLFFSSVLPELYCW
jgi:hypothetical protein